MAHPSSMAGLAAVVARAAEIAEQRERCPRAARLADDLQAILDGLGRSRQTFNNEADILFRAFLDGALALLARDMARGREITDEDEEFVRSGCAKAKGGL